jgi:three-Cys-motif partner protein
MPRKDYEWDFSEPPSIGPHSLAKHRILREYVEEYVRVLTSNPRIDRLVLSLVDGFAGGGLYVDHATPTVVHPGSPQILLDAVFRAEAAANATRKKPFHIDARYFFVDSAPSAIFCLRRVLSGRPRWHSESPRVQVIEGAFDANLDQIIATIGERGTAGRSIFVLDQYGYTAAPLSVLARIAGALPKAEIFLTLAVGWIVAYLADLKTAATKLGMSAAFVNRLTEYGDEGVPLDDPDARPTFRALQILLKDVFTTHVGTAFYTPFFIVSRDSNRAYWFLHLANSPRAHDVVKALHWKIENHFQHFGGAGLDMLGYDPDHDPDVTHQLPFQFDDPARVWTRQALQETVTARIGRDFTGGVRFDNLFSSICNGTPATKAMLAETVSTLCTEGELEKRGGGGEARARTTKPKDDDIILVARQRTWSFGAPRRP